MSCHETKDGLHQYVSRKQKKQITGNPRCFALDCFRVIEAGSKFFMRLDSEAPENDYRRRELNRAVDSERNQQQASRSYSCTNRNRGFNHHPNYRDYFQPERSSQCESPSKYDRFAHTQNFRILVSSKSTSNFHFMSQQHWS